MTGWERPEVMGWEEPEGTGWAGSDASCDPPNTKDETTLQECMGTSGKDWS